MYNAFVSFPGYIPANLRHFYKEVAVIPNPGDSLNRSFTLMLVKGGTTDTIYVKGRASFTIGKSKELDNVLLGQSGGTLTAPSDTFYNCERQVLNSAINQGIANYQEYLRHFRDSITASFRNYLATTVSEQLQLGYLNQEFNYTLYNYDRAGNLTFTVPPAGSAPLTSVTDLDLVDAMRTANTPWSSPAPAYTKKNAYEYNTYNNVVKQQTIDGGMTRFFYDVAGRLMFSQNAKQAPGGYYTYNIYDKQNRVVETGEALLGCPYFAAFYPGGGAAPACYYGYADGYGLLASPDPYFIHYLDIEPADSLPIYIRAASVRRDVVRTVYDTAAFNLGGLTGHDAQQNLRKRVAAVISYDSLHAWDTASYPTHAYATNYSYDIDGNVKTLVQDFPELYDAKQQYKRIDYDYDLISGKVNMLSYNRGWPDQFYQRYFYDGANRIFEVQTSKDGWIWQKDAAYRYYPHGPLARIELGELHVQGIDYAYTIQGWLKAVNSDTLCIDMDMGSDGLFGGVNQVTAKDAVAHTIDYFNSDYKPITSHSVQHVTPVSLSLYNGNISRQTMAIDTFRKLNKQYMYDQLNRIHSATYASVDPVYNTLTGLTDFRSNYSYDADGNLQTLVRYGNNGLMDSLSYSYSSVTPNNQLTNIIEDAADVHDNNIKYFAGPAGTPRYRYDPIGNTIGDLVGGQDTIEWNLYNKVVRTVRNSDTTYMAFRYDGAGNRVKKSHVKPVYGSGSLPILEMTQDNDYYVRDAQGNILAVYHEDAYYTIPGAMALVLWDGNFSLAEHDIYGSSRLGVRKYYKNQVGMDQGYAVGTIDTLQLLKHQPWYSLEYQDAIKEDSTNLYGNTYTDMCYAQQTIGQKQYEITDHLGDVLATVSDKRAADSILGAHVTGQIDTIINWKPVVASATDYYPFGMQMPGRYTSDTATHCFDITQTKLVPYFYSQYHAAISTYFSTVSSGTASITTTSGSDLRMSMSGTGYVTMTIDSLVPGYTQTLSMVETGANATFDVLISCMGTVVGSAVMNSTGTYNITFTPTAATATITVQLQFASPPPPKFIQFSGLYLPRSDSSLLENVVTTVCDGDKYQYGYNGQLKVNEWAGAGNHNTAKYWEYDTRLGRRANLDPKPNEWESPYSCFGGNPIWRSDVNGDTWWDVVVGYTHSVLDAASGGLVNLSGTYKPTSSSDYHQGQLFGDVHSMMIAANEGATGAGMTEGALLATAGSGGLASEVTVPTAAVGIGMQVHSVIMMARSSHNLGKHAANAGSAKPPNPNGSKGNSDHQEKVKEVTNKAHSETKPGETVVSEKKVQGHPSTRRPDAQILDENGKTRKVFEAERKPNSQRNIKREAEYKKLGIEQETHKVGK
ncbi:MAG: hypothetical protein K0Q79_1654 [Flavipsychrobacter sp.]|jgi:hypothetical protein|nr:hypothetical protein [Flavipsychrobacter sp.]